MRWLFERLGRMGLGTGEAMDEAGWASWSRWWKVVVVHVWEWANRSGRLLEGMEENQTHVGSSETKPKRHDGQQAVPTLSGVGKAQPPACRQGRRSKLWGYWRTPAIAGTLEEEEHRRPPLEKKKINSVKSKLEFNPLSNLSTTFSNLDFIEKPNSKNSE